MTKRFTNVNEDIFQYGEWYCSAKSEHCADVIATALNMVTEENEQLKTQLSEQGTQIDFLKDENKHMRKLVNENEQLKKELESFKPIIFESDGKPVTLYKKGDVE